MQITDISDMSEWDYQVSFRQPLSDLDLERFITLFLQDYTYFICEGNDTILIKKRS